MATASVRPAAVAGHFYPADPRVLHTQIADMLGNAVPLERLARPPKALIVPHAGYIYSGPVAANAYAALSELRDTVRKVVLLGPAHRIAVAGAALPAALRFQTPLGEVDVDRNDWLRLQSLPGVAINDAAHALEHSLEVQLPFLQSVLDRFTLLPLVVGGIASERLGEILETLWGGPETLIVVSSDLSHYLPYQDARLTDRNTCEQILRFDTHIDGEQACGATPVNGFLHAARRHRLEAHLLDMRSSGDTAGQRDRVVGYASFAFCEEHASARH